MRTKIMQVIELLAAKDRMTPEELAHIMGVSARTVRTYINQVNKELLPFARVMKHRGNGYELIVEDKAQFCAWREEQCAAERTAKPSSPHERVQFLISDLLLRSDWITLDELSQILFVSKGALSADIKSVEKEIENFQLTIKNDRTMGLKWKVLRLIAGSVWQIRF